MTMSRGVLNALHRNRNVGVCDCGFALPVYPGRYPSKCPLCGAPRTPSAPAAGGAPEK